MQHDYHHHYEKPAPYYFGYDVGDEHGSKHHYEESDGDGNVKGVYGYIDKDGIHRLVEYVADEHGYRAIVKTNEPGTKSESPADTHFYSDYDPHEKWQREEHHPSAIHEDEHDNHKEHEYK